MEHHPQVYPSQVHRAPGRPQERDGGGAQHGPRHGRQVRGQHWEISECDFLQYFNGFLLRYFYRVQKHARGFYIIILRTWARLQPDII